MNRRYRIGESFSKLKALDGELVDMGQPFAVIAQTTIEDFRAQREVAKQLLGRYPNTVPIEEWPSEMLCYRIATD